MPRCSGRAAHGIRDQVLAGVDRAVEHLGRVVGHVERAVRIPAAGLLGQLHLVRPERRPVRLLGVLLVRAAEADMGADGDDGRPVVGLGGIDGGRDRGDVVAVLDPLGVPAVGLEAGEHVLAERPRRRAVERDAVVVVEDDELAQLQVAGQRAGLGGDPFLHVAVAGDDVGPVVDDVVPGPVELLRQRRSAMAMPTALPRPWPSGPVVASTPEVRPYSGWPGVIEPHWRKALSSSRRRRSRQVEHRVQEHRRVTGRQDEAVAVGPARVPRRVAEVAGPQGVRHRRGAHRCAGVPGVRLLDAIDREGPDGVDRELIEAVRGEGHSLSPVARGLGGAADLPRSNRTPQIGAGMLGEITDPRHAARAHPSPRATDDDRPSVVVVGDIVVDVILAPERDIELGSDVRGRVLLRAGGSAATAARWPGRFGRSLDARVRSRARWPGSGARVGRERPTVSPCGPCASRARRPRGSACSSTRTASARSSRTAAPRSCCAPRTSRPPGSRAPTPSIFPRTRSSTSRSGGPAWRRSGWAARRGRSSPWTSRRARRCSPSAAAARRP